MNMINIATATIDREFLILWLKNKETLPDGRHGFINGQSQFAELDALTEAIDDLDPETVEFLMGEIGKADLNVAKELARILEDSTTDQWLCPNAKFAIGRRFSLLDEVTQGAKNCRPDGALSYLHIIDEGERCSSSRKIPISDVQRMLRQLTAARRDKEQNLDCE